MGSRADLQRLQIAPSTYHALKGRPSPRSLRDPEIGPRHEAIWQQNYSVYGRRKLTRAARIAGLGLDAIKCSN